MERSLIILKYVGRIPSFGSCSQCQHKFFTPATFRFDAVRARAYLENKFHHHKCPSDDQRTTFDKADH
jgi:hypothetical protein